MRSRGIALAAMLAMAPFGARAADLVVLWEEGQSAEENEAVREIIAAFEQNTGKEVELVLGKQEQIAADLMAAIEAGRRTPTSSSRWLIPNPMNNGPTRVGWSKSPTS